ncbi:398_t:CDS:2 [Funneliformis caledonium]|uniref:398_t:CDS:1 n=1 Tax=Funneliformis caledonium TaxID=1117310 RepID=A0A9N9HRN8_9GLOM|nr:398_t:CDS:2 [Funneliformis caledonium]
MATKEEKIQQELNDAKRYYEDAKKKLEKLEGLNGDLRKLKNAIKRKAIEVDEIDQVDYFKRLKGASPPSAYAGRGDCGWPSGQCDCQTAVPTDEVYKFVLELTEEMSDPFPNEDARTSAFHHLLETIGIKLNKIIITGCTTDGSVLTKDGSMLMINLEVKPELGEGNGCPYIQGITFYGKKVADYLEGKEALRLPCFVLYLAGPFLGIAGIIHTKNKIVTDPLVGPLLLMFLQYDREQMTQIARMFTALKSAYYTLCKYYDENLETGPQSLWPYCHSFYYQTKKVEFEYIQQLESTKLLFIVKTKQSDDNTDLSQRLLVKFTEIYGTSELVTKKTTEIVKHIHNGGYVHGDLRKENILYQEGKDRLVNLALVDFDWADHIGKAVYPPFLNTKGITRYHEAGSGKLIESEHDIFMLNTIKNH